MPRFVLPCSADVVALVMVAVAVVFVVVAVVGDSLAEFLLGDVKRPCVCVCVCAIVASGPCSLTPVRFAWPVVAIVAVVVVVLLLLLL